MTDELAGGWNLAKLAARSAEERHTVWRNARNKGTPKALALVQFIEHSGLDYAQVGGIGMSDPRVIEMREIIESAAGADACRAATAAGLPALAGVEPMIVDRMGDRYGAFSQMTLTAGAIVAEQMRRLGYKITKLRGHMPAGSVAKTASCWANE